MLSNPRRMTTQAALVAGASTLGYLVRLFNQGAITYKNYERLTKASPSVRAAAVRKFKSSGSYKMGSCKKNSVKCLGKQVRKLSKQMADNTANHTHRQRVTGRANIGENLVKYLQIDTGGKLSDIELAAAKLRYYDATTNALITVDASSGSYNRDLHLSIYYKLLVKNNYQTPVEVRIYDCVPKDSTGLGPVSLLQSGLDDQGTGLLDSSPLLFPTDSKNLTDVWTIKSSIKTLMPGQHMVASHFHKKFDYDISTNDAHTLIYQKSQGGHIFFVRITGTLGHDSAQNEQGMMPAGIDYQMDIVYKFSYNAGKDLDDFSINDGSSTFTNNGVYSSRPVSDNISFSIA